MSTLQFRRGVAANRSPVTPAVGEPLFTTDTKQLFVGDGATAGGIGVAPVNSPAFTGLPTAPTTATNDNSTNLATTAFVQGVLQAMLQNVVLFKGVVDASKVSPAAAGVIGTPAAGWQYRVSVAGSTAFGFAAQVGDWVVYDGSAWQHVTGAAGAITSSDGVISVTQTGPESFTLALPMLGLSRGGAGADLTALANGTMLKKNGTALVAAVAGTDYLAPASVIDGGTF